MAVTVAGFWYWGYSLFYFSLGSIAALVAVGAPAAVCVFLVFRGTIREAYYFDKTKDGYAFVRQFIHRAQQYLRLK